MDVITHNFYGSTFSGNPVAGAVVMAALEVIRDEKLTQNARKQEKFFQKEMNKFVEKSIGYRLEVRAYCDCDK